MGNLNPYIYTYQNPVKYTDPNGKQIIAPPIIGEKDSKIIKKLFNHLANGWSQQYTAKTNADKYGGLERYRQWQANPGYNEGEGKYDRIFRLIGIVIMKKCWILEVAVTICMVDMEELQKVQEV